MSNYNHFFEEYDELMAEANLKDFISEEPTNATEIIFEDNSFRYDNHQTANSRYNKFFKLIVTKHLPWYLRQSMLDLFPKIENYFFISKRKNFINMNQLAIEMCRVLGYPLYSNLFTPLKTKTRVKQVRSFVDDAMGENSGIVIKLMRLEDVEMIALEPLHSVDVSKVFGDHMYSDRNFNRI